MTRRRARPAADAPATPLPTTAEVFRETRTFALAAGSGRVEGTVLRGRRAARVELEGAAAGANQHVVVEEEGSGRAEVLTVDGRHWLAGDVAFWRARGERRRDALAAAAGWHAVSGAQAQRVAPWTLRSLLTRWFAEPGVAALESAPAPVASEGSPDGDLWVLGRPGGARLWVAADGSGRLVRLLLPGRAPTDVAFSGWERVEPFAPPGPGEVVTR